MHEARRREIRHPRCLCFSQLFNPTSQFGSGATFRFGNEFRRAALVVPDGPAIRERRVNGNEMPQTAGEAAPDIGGWNIVAPLLHAFADTCDRSLGSRHVK